MLRLWRAVCFLLCAIGASALILFVIVISISYWHTLLLRLLGRSWNSVVDSLGTRTLGYVVAEIILLTGVFFAAFMVLVYQSGEDERGRAIKKSLIAAVAAAVATICMWAATFGWSAAKTIYNDYQRLTLLNSRMREENARLSCENQRIKSSLPSPQKVVVRQAEKLVPVSVAESPRIMSFPVSRAQRLGMSEIEYLLTTNVIRTPVELVVACDFPIADTSAVPLTPTGGSVSVASNKRISPTQIKVSMKSPAWSPTMPLWITIFFAGPVDRMPSCSFSSP